MPPRSNLFQRVVYLVQRQLAEGSKVTESAMLPDAVTGMSREVDVVVEGHLPGVPVPVVVSIECRDHGRKQSVEWVEEANAKHAFLPTTLLILVSSSGFTAQARAKAEFMNVTLWEPTKPDEVSAREIVGKLQSLWVKKMTYQREELQIDVALENSDGETVLGGDIGAPISLDLVDDLGGKIGTIYELFDKATFGPQHGGQQEVFRDALTGKHRLTVGITDPGFKRHGSEEISPLYTFRLDAPKEHLKIRLVTATVDVDVKVLEVPLEHLQIADAAYSYGTATLDDDNVVLVVTEPDGQAPRFDLEPLDP